MDAETKAVALDIVKYLVLVPLGVAAFLAVFGGNIIAYISALM
jgi:hypothetical protein